MIRAGFGLPLFLSQHVQLLARIKAIVIEHVQTDV